MSRGTRESHWLVMRRCLAVIRRVQRGLVTWQDLLQAMEELEGPQAYGEGDERLRRRRLEKDLQRIREHLDVDLYYDHDAGGYIILESQPGFFDLPDSDLETLVWLEQTFGEDSPQHKEVRALLGRLRSYLDAPRLNEIDGCRITLAMDLARRDEDEISPALWQKLNRALAGRRRIHFTYLSPPIRGRPTTPPRGGSL